MSGNFVNEAVDLGRERHLSRHNGTTCPLIHFGKADLHA
jgi:hypothetical protein